MTADFVTIGSPFQSRAGFSAFVLGVKTRVLKTQPYGGKYKGRKPTAKAKSEEVIQLRQNGMKNQEIADQLNIGIASVYRILKQNKKD